MRAFLHGIVRDSNRHGRFLNMLSMLEHMGSRKIMLSQMNRDMNETTLKHLAEEARHAFFFKRQAERVMGAPVQGYTDANTHTRAAARMYFDRLAAFINDTTGEEAAYPWTTRLVEIRACWFYEIYEEVLREAGVSVSLKSLLAEEEGHLAEMKALCGDEAELLNALCAHEEQLFARLWQAITAA